MTLSRLRSCCDRDLGVASATLHFKVEPYFNLSWGMNPLEGLSGWMICSRVFVDTGFVSWTACIAAAITEDGERVPDRVVKKLIYLPVAMSEDGIGEPPEELLVAFDTIAGFVQRECDSQHMDLLEERDAQADHQAAALQDELSRAVINGEARIVAWRRSIRSGELDSDGVAQMRSDIVRMEDLISEAGGTVRNRVASIRADASVFAAAVLAALPTSAEFEHLWVARWTTAPLRTNGGTECSEPSALMDELRYDARWFGQHTEKRIRGQSVLPAPCSEEDVRRRKRSATIRDLERADRERQAARRRLAARHENLPSSSLSLRPEQRDLSSKSSTSNLQLQQLALRPSELTGWYMRRLWPRARDDQRILSRANPFASEEQKRIEVETTIARWRSALRGEGIAGDGDLSDDAVVKWARRRGFECTWSTQRPEKVLQNSRDEPRKGDVADVKPDPRKEHRALTPNSYVRAWRKENRQVDNPRYTDRDAWFNTPEGQAYIATIRERAERRDETRRLSIERRKTLMASKVPDAIDWSEGQDPVATRHRADVPVAPSTLPAASQQDRASLVGVVKTASGDPANATVEFAAADLRPAVGSPNETLSHQALGEAVTIARNEQPTGPAIERGSLPPASTSKIITDERAVQRARWRAEDEEDRIRRGREMKRD